MTKELFILTEEELKEIKEKSLEVIDILPTDLTQALIIIAFINRHIYEVTGKSVEDICIKKKTENNGN